MPLKISIIDWEHGRLDSIKRRQCCQLHSQLFPSCELRAIPFRHLPWYSDIISVPETKRNSLKRSPEANATGVGREHIASRSATVHFYNSTSPLISLDTLQSLQLLSPFLTTFIESFSSENRRLLFPAILTKTSLASAPSGK
jgi:hypothetical protein